jgi:hypothetical protein
VPAAREAARLEAEEAAARAAELAAAEAEAEAEEQAAWSAPSYAAAAAPPAVRATGEVARVLDALKRSPLMLELPANTRGLEAVTALVSRTARPDAAESAA